MGNFYRSNLPPMAVIEETYAPHAVIMMTLNC